jgi:HSP20 family protein
MYNPFGEMTSLRDAMAQLLADSFVRPGVAGSRTIPVDVYETADDLVVVASLPGASSNDVHVTATAETLTISYKATSDTEKEGANQWTWYLHELTHGEFSRTLDLPVEVDPQKARAFFQNGLLRLELPKVEAARQHTLKIQTGQQQAPQSVPVSPTK